MEEPKKENVVISRKKKSEATTSRLPGCGIDVGTGFLVSAASVDGKTIYKTQRDAFIDLENNAMTKNMLTKLNAPFISSEDSKLIYVIGDDALQLGNFFNRTCRRPLAKGVLSTKEKECLM